MDLGTFSISLAVKDLHAARTFYEAIGFSLMDGDEQSWVMLQNGSRQDRPVPGHVRDQCRHVQSTRR